MERANLEYGDDFPINKIPDWINEFFDQYQPERSKREDLECKSDIPDGCNYVSFNLDNGITTYGCGALNSEETH